MSKHVQAYMVSDAFFILGSTAIMRSIQREMRFLNIQESIALGLEDLTRMDREDLVSFGSTFTAHDFMGQHKFHLNIPSACTVTIRYVQDCILTEKGRKLTRFEVVLLGMLKISG